MFRSSGSAVELWNAKSAVYLYPRSRSPRRTRNINLVAYALMLGALFMRDDTTVKKIGYKQAFKAITIGLVIAYLIMALMAGPLWLFQIDYAPTIIFATIVTYIVGYYFGGLTGVWILKKNRSAIVFGVTGGFLIVWTTTFIGSLIGFINEGLTNRSPKGEAIYDYVYKPMVLVTTFGFIPIVLVGIWFGLSIKKLGNKIQNQQTSSP